MHKVEQGPDVEQQQKSKKQLEKEFEILMKNKQIVVDKMVAIEERILSTSMSLGLMESEYKEAERLTKIYQWITNIEYNRYQLPIIQAQEAARKASKIIAPVTGQA